MHFFVICDWDQTWSESFLYWFSLGPNGKGINKSFIAGTREGSISLCRLWLSKIQTLVFQGTIKFEAIGKKEKLQQSAETSHPQPQMFLVNLLITKRDTLSRIMAVLGHANVCLQIMGFKFVITTFKLSADMRIGSNEKFNVW